MQYFDELLAHSRKAYFLLFGVLRTYNLYVYYSYAKIIIIMANISSQGGPELLLYGFPLSPLRMRLLASC